MLCHLFRLILVGVALSHVGVVLSHVGVALSREPTGSYTATRTEPGYLNLTYTFPSYRLKVFIEFSCASGMTPIRGIFPLIKESDVLYKIGFTDPENGFITPECLAFITSFRSACPAYKALKHGDFYDIQYDVKHDRPTVRVHGIAFELVHKEAPH
ncbi:hypothetical protein Pmar_PMAR001145 [Perkinsus marinus ATCC 50983]|uniref:Uncharacterized protein n=1 Tax=Perkinsus marinus (strain ATCC 50983 / TXsc) TaxID=423536 RepID=C5KSZ6_PERM5|nr:hypothetical protein Pmar_PMAR001145 [Perkinsus marinus ATCC 50983]EER12346.1 hypothetical protein Pmar_PMAR001145 [Perkinsus marinus ATCC 50983]|eukprot:XP_002780551.1 hypothetical protein Pmar_PMAR001145 [Perkinsus marinus ATCC 50983]